MGPSFLGARLVLWWALIASGSVPEALADIRVEVDRPGLRTVKKLTLAYATAIAGNAEEATGLLWELESKLADPRLSLLTALVYSAMDDKGKAFEQVDRAWRIREPGLLFLKVAPWADPLRSDPRYGEMLGKLGLG
jgi:hypothetical protein